MPFWFWILFFLVLLLLAKAVGWLLSPFNFKRHYIRPVEVTLFGRVLETETREINRQNSRVRLHLTHVYLQTTPQSPCIPIPRASLFYRKPLLEPAPLEGLVVQITARPIYDGKLENQRTFQLLRWRYADSDAIPDDAVSLKGAP